jgi:hypothetical protein
MTIFLHHNNAYQPVSLSFSIFGRERKREGGRKAGEGEGEGREEGKRDKERNKKQKGIRFVPQTSHSPDLAHCIFCSFWK